MKKIVGFAVLLLLFICTFLGGMHFTKQKASKTLFEALDILSAQKQKLWTECPKFDSDTLDCMVSITIHFKNHESSKTKHGTGIIASLNKKTGEAMIYSCEHLFREKDYSLFDIEIYLYGLENSKYAIKGNYLGGCEAFDFALLSIKNSDILSTSKTKSVIFQNGYFEGQDVYAIGNALGKGLSVSKGIAGKKSEKQVSNFSFNMIQTDAPLNFGCSGGGLFSPHGELVGMICAKEAITEAEGIGYALPSAICQALAKKILQYGEVRILMPNFACQAIPYFDKENATVSFRLTVAESNDNRIECSDVLLYAIMDGEVFTFSDSTSFSVFLLSCESKSVVLAFYRDGNVFEVDISECEKSTVF